jgi:hypothetical protein
VRRGLGGAGARSATPRRARLWCTKLQVEDEEGKEDEGDEEGRGDADNYPQRIALKVILYYARTYQRQRQPAGSINFTTSIGARPSRRQRQCPPRRTP